MSVVIDGKDILRYNSYSAIVMKNSLEGLLNGARAGIPAGVLKQARHLIF